MKRLLGFSLALAMCLAGCGRGPKVSPTSVAEGPAVEPPATSVPAEFQVSDLVEMVRPSTVLIYAEFGGDEAGTGTGIIYNADGHTITNAHVVEGAEIVKVQVPDTNRWLSAKIVGLSPCDDLAVIDIAGSGFTPAVLGESDDLKLGEELIALGYPLAADLGTDLTVTRGIVSKLHAQVDQLEDLIQTDASINPGNSGGPLVNMRGEVVGINTVKVEYSASGRPIQGLNFAIGTSFAKEIVAQLQWGENLHWVGLNTIPNSAEIADHFGLTTSEGLLVYAAATGSPADSGDLQPGDVLISMEGVAVNSKADLCSVLKSHHPDDLLKVEILRGDSLLTRQIGGPLAATPEPVSARGPRLGSITFATGVTDDDTPIGPGTAFPDGTTRVYGIFDYEGISSGTTFKYVWYLDGDEDVVDSETWESPEDGTYWVYIHNDDGVIPGAYDLYLYVDGELLQTGSFVIGESRAVPVIEEITFAEGVTEDDEPINPAYFFPAGTTYVYGVFQHSGIPAGAEFEYKYYRDGQEDVVNTFTWQRDSEGTYYVYLYNDDGIIPANYDLHLYVAGELVQTGSFVVQEAGQSSAFQKYSSKALGFSLQYPAVWELDDSGDDSVFFSDPDSSIMAFVVVSVEDKGTTPEDLAATFLEGLEDDYPDLEVVDTNDGTFSGSPALVTVADFTYDGDDMRLVLYSVVRDGSGYSMGQVGEESDLDMITGDLIEPMWQSFYFLD